MKRSLSILLALILLLGLLPMQALAATDISSVSLALDAPTAGAVPDYTAVFPEGARYYSAEINGTYLRNDIQWKDQTANEWLFPDSVFQIGHKYDAYVFLTAQAGYAFTDDTAAAVNGQEALKYLTSDGQLEVMFSFPPVDDPELSFVSLTVDAPVVGALPDYSAVLPEGARYHSVGLIGTYIREGVQWKDVTTNAWLSPDVSVFESGHQYQVFLLLAAQSGYGFTTGTAAEVNGNTAAAELIDGDIIVTYTFPALPDPNTLATVILTAEDVWGDGSGYQLLLDADATAYGIQIPESGPLTSSGDAPAELYEEFEYTIPKDADGSTTTQNIVLNGSVCIQIPAGLYDLCITNPTPGEKIWIASSDGKKTGCWDDFLFEAGRTYEFSVSPLDGREHIDLAVSVTPGVTFPLWVGGTQVTAENMDNVLGDEYTVHQVVFTPPAVDEPARLTLFNASIQFNTAVSGSAETSAGIYSDGMDLTLELEQLSTVNGNDRENVSGVIVDGADLTVTGNGGLYVFPGDSEGASIGLRAGNVTMENGIVRIRGGASPILSAGVYVEDSFVLDGGSLVTEGGESDSSFGVYAGTIDLRSGTIVSTGKTCAFDQEPYLSDYADPYVTVNGAAQEEGSAEWDEASPLGGTGSAYKYVKVESEALRYPVMEPIPVAACLGEYYSAHLDVVSGTGTYPYAFTVTGLPDWLEFDDAFRQIYGTPTQLGSFDFTVTVTDAKGMTETKDVTIVVMAERPYATVILTAGDVWGDGSGYQMLLDADAVAYGTLFPISGPLTEYGCDAPSELYEQFEYKIPENADGSLTTQNIVLNGTASVRLPEGHYDFCITNPTPGENIWIVSSNGSLDARQDDFFFEAGKTYEFTVSEFSNQDGIELVITDSVITLPDPVVSVTAEALPGKVAVSWTAAAGADHYRLARQSTGTGWTLLDGCVSGTSYEDGTVEAGKRYRYLVCAENTMGKGTSATSAVVTALAPLTLPDAVVSVTAEALPGRVAVSWTAAAGADHYRLARQSTGTGWTLLDGNISGTSYEDTTAEAGKRYRYLVCAENSVGKGASATSTAVEALPALTIPAAVESITAEALPGKIAVSWTAAAGADHYRLARQSTGTGWTLLDGNISGTSYEDTTAEAGKRYRYLVCAENSVGKGASVTSTAMEALPALTIPAAVESITAEALPGRVVVSWTAAADADHYRLARQSTGTGWTLLDGNISGTSYEDTTAEAGKRYRYLVCAENSVGKGASATSAAVEALSALTIPGAVESITAEAQPGKVAVSWTAAAGADHYRLARQSTGTGWTLLDGSIFGTSYEDGTAEAGKRYRYLVCAENSVGKGASATSTAVEALPALTIPGAVESITAEAQPGRVVVSWTSAVMADHYRLARQSTGTGWTLLDGSIFGTSYEDTTAEAGKRYRYLVCAENSVGKGASATSTAITAN